MTDYKVPYTTILEINPHPNADRLALATVYGFQVVIPKDTYVVGQKIVFVPIDSILSPEMDAKLFPEGSKIKLHHRRVRQIKIRSFPSQGMIINPSEVSDIVNLDQIELETDLSKILSIEKYEPPVRANTNTPGKPGSRKMLANPHFHSYNGLQNIKWNPFMFKEGDLVVIQEKLHGTNARAGKLPCVANTWIKKIKRYFKILPAFENVYGSNRVDISNASGYKGYYGEDVYGKVFQDLDVFNKIKPNETVFGEIVGPGIQKGYHYGLPGHKFVLFDVKVLNTDGTQSWLKPDEVEMYAMERGFQYVPLLYRGPFNKELAYTLTKGASKYNDGSEKVREGIVIKAMDNYSVESNKMALKWVSEDYLSDATNTDEH